MASSAPTIAATIKAKNTADQTYLSHLMTSWEDSHAKRRTFINEILDFCDHVEKSHYDPIDPSLKAKVDYYLGLLREIEEEREKIKKDLEGLDEEMGERLAELGTLVEAYYNAGGIFDPAVQMAEQRIWKAEEAKMKETGEIEEETKDESSEGDKILAETEEMLRGLTFMEGASKVYRY